jgi:hypothetical protein
LFEGWRLEIVEDGRFQVEMAEIEVSPLQLTPAQKAERRNTVLARYARQALDGPGRELWRERLLLCAYVLALLGNEDEARMAAATALALERTDESVPGLFLELMRNARLGENEEDDNRKGPAPDRGGLIVT